MTMTITVAMSMKYEYDMTMTMYMTNYDSKNMISHVTGAVAIIVVVHQGCGRVLLTKYSSTPSTPNIYQVQVLVKYSFF